MFSISLLLLLSTHLVITSLAAPPLLRTINPASLTSNLNIASPSLSNSTALEEGDASAQALSLTDSHLSILSTPRHVTTTIIKITINPNINSTAVKEEIEDVVYMVPNTETTLHMSFRRDRPLDRKSFGGFVLLMQDQIEAHIAASGDGWLLPKDDPFKRDWPGFYFIAKSSPLPVPEGEAHLTYGVMVNVLKGIFEVMYLGETLTSVGPLPFGCYCNIDNYTADLLGTAVIWPGPIHIS